MKIVFCNISWMKKYQGITDSDKPKYCGTYVTEQNAGNDIFNFSEYNGKCYGYVKNEGDLVLPTRLEEEIRQGTVPAAAHSPSEHLDPDIAIEGFLVVWCSFKDRNTARIIGWYNNAVLFREEQYQPSFTNPDYELDYFFEANSEDCFLLPENKRTFKIERAAKAGKGKGFGRPDVWFADSPYGQGELIPEVIKYIESYNGPRENFVLTDAMINALPAEAYTGTHEALFQKGLKCFESVDCLQALTWFNAARKIKETPQNLYVTAFCLYHLSAFDKARGIIEKYLEKGQEDIHILELLAFCTDMTGDWEKTIFYLEKMIPMTADATVRNELKNTVAEIHAYLETDE